MDHSLVSRMPYLLALVQLLTDGQNNDKHLKNDLWPCNENKTLNKSGIAGPFGDTIPSTIFQNSNLRL